MEICVECGTKLPREEMFGTPGEFRCPKCSRARRERYVPKRVAVGVRQPWASYSIATLATVATLLFWSDRAQVGGLLMDLRVPVWDGQLWRLVTSAFLHGDAIHLLFNLSWIVYLGRSIEDWLGPIRYVGLVLLLAMVGSAAQFLYSGSPSIGLSGVACGFIGLCLALRNEKDFAAAFLQPATIRFLVVSFIVFAFLIPNIAHLAHLGGFVFGWLIGMACTRKALRFQLWGTVAAAFLLATMCLYTPWQPLFCYHRAEQATHQGNEAAARYWMERARKAESNDLPD